MNTFKAYFQKEFRESLSHQKFLILFVGLFLFAIITPPMLKMLPNILKSSSEFQGMPEINFTPLVAAQNYSAKTLPQIGVMVICLLFGGIINDEFSSRKLVFPITNGCNKITMVLTKFFFYSIAISLMLAISLFTEVWYSNILFVGPKISIYETMIALLQVSTYLTLMLSLIMFFSSLFNKGVISSILAFIINIIFISFLAQFKSIFNPYTLIYNSNLFNGTFNYVNILMILFYSLIAISLCSYITYTKEIN